MKILSLSVLILLMFVSINSCKSKKVTSKAETKVEEKIEEEIETIKSNFIKDGYSKAIVIHDESKSEPCSYLIQLDNGGLLEPLTFTNNDFKSNNELIWIKFVRQRRLGRCDKAQPIELLEIIKREK